MLHRRDELTFTLGGRHCNSGKTNRQRFPATKIYLMSTSNGTIDSAYLSLRLGKQIQRSSVAPRSHRSFLEHFPGAFRVAGVQQRGGPLRSQRDVGRPVFNRAVTLRDSWDKRAAAPRGEPEAKAAKTTAPA